MFPQLPEINKLHKALSIQLAVLMIVDLLTYKELWNSNDQSHYEGLSKKTRNKLMKNHQKQDENKVH